MKDQTTYNANKHSEAVKRYHENLKKQHQKNAESLRALDIQVEACEMAGFDWEEVIVYMHYKKPMISFKGHTIKGGLLTERKRLFDILEAFPIWDNKTDFHTLQFAGKDPIQTGSSVHIKWQNFDNPALNRKPEFEIRWNSGAYLINVEVNGSELFKNALYTRHEDGKHKGFGRYETLTRHNLTGFSIQGWSGGSRCLYFRDDEAETLEEFLYFVFTGEHIAESERNQEMWGKIKKNYKRVLKTA